MKYYYKSDENGMAFHDFAIIELSILRYKEKIMCDRDKIIIVLSFEDIEYQLIMENVKNFSFNSKYFGYLGEILLCELGVTENKNLKQIKGSKNRR